MASGIHRGGVRRFLAQQALMAQRAAMPQRRPLPTYIDEPLWIDSIGRSQPISGPRPDQSPYWLTVNFDEGDGERYTDHQLMKILIDKIERGEFVLSCDPLCTTQRFCISFGLGMDHNCQKSGECEKASGSRESCQERILDDLVAQACWLRRKVYDGGYCINRRVVFRKDHYRLDEQTPESS